MFKRKKTATPHERSGSNSTVATVATRPSNVEPPPVSPLQITFDFERPLRPSTDSFSRPRTSDGLGGIASPAQPSKVGLQPPLLPPIPRIASRDGSLRSDVSGEDGQVAAKSKAQKEPDNVSLVSQASAPKPSANLSGPFDMMFSSRPPSAAATDTRPATALGASGASTPRMESTLFPQTDAPKMAPPSPTTPAMDRAFIDSRDRPYNHVAPRLTMQTNHSSPNLLRPASPSGVNFSKRNPSTSSKLSQQPSLPDLKTSSSTTRTTLTKRTNTLGSTSTPSSASPTITIGTPYGATSSSFPLPQHVATRPKTAGATATVQGVSIPTHHTSTARADTKSERRKTRLLNPMALLQRRKSGQDGPAVADERLERTAQAQALARQSKVAATGVERLPADYDPRIKGRVVHDFSAPRSNRNTFYAPDGVPPQPLQTSKTMPIWPSKAGDHSRQLSFADTISEVGSKRSHTPVFVEHLNETPETSRRVSSLHAENLENKDFLKRASKHSFMTSYSQESAILPPFARRSQQLDPTQASFICDDDSKRSSDPSSGRERDSNFSSAGEISPVTARSSAFNAEYRASFSPVSPSSPGKTFRTIATEHGNRPASQDKHRKTPSGSTTRPLSISVPPLTIDTIEESPTSSSSTGQAMSGATGQAAQPEIGIAYVPPVPGLANDALNPPKMSEITRTSLDSPNRSLFERTAGIPTPDMTPEAQQAESAYQPTFTASAPKLVEKRPSAVGHGKRSSNPPKHRASNASRFSFQLGESVAEEHALEEKHRRITSRSSEMTVGAPKNDEDDEDFFDEDAMDDMDEMEIQEQQQKPTTSPADPPSQSLWYLQQARQVLRQRDSDEESMDDEHMPSVTNERDIPYADHPAFRMHSALANHSRNNSIIPGPPPSIGGTASESGDWRDNTIEMYMHGSISSGHHSRAHSTTSGHTNALSNSPVAEFIPENFSISDSLSKGAGGAKSRSNFYMQPQAAGHSLDANTEKSTLQQETDGDAEKGAAAADEPASAAHAQAEVPSHQPTDSNAGSRVISGMSYSTISAESPLNIQLLGDNADGYFENASDSTRKSSPLGQKNSDSSKHSRVTSNDSRTTPTSSPRPEKTTFGNSIGIPEGRINSFDSSDGASFKSAAQTQSTDFSSGVQDFGFSAITTPSTFTKQRSVGGRHSGASTVKTANADEGRLRGDSTSTTGSQRPYSTAFGFNMPRYDSQVPDTGRPRTASDAFQSNGFGGFNFNGTPNQSNNASRRQSALAQTRSNNPFIHQRVFSVSSTVDGSVLGDSPIFELGAQSEAGSPPPGRNNPQATPPRNGVRRSNDGEMLPRYDMWNEPKVAQMPVLKPQIGESAAYHGGIGKGLQVRTNRNQQSPKAARLDDMYFDDGNFDRDITSAPGRSVDENSFDDDTFLTKGRGLHNGHVPRPETNGRETSFTGEGPYPTFAMPNAARARKRDSQMMLEDVILQGPVDPKLIPQRNPSEDAKRLGLSDKVPPLPVMGDNPAAQKRMRASLQSYHAALADAANKAAVDGRFVRMPSAASVARKASVASKYSILDDRSIYSNDEEGGELVVPDFDDDDDDDDSARTSVVGVDPNNPPATQETGFGPPSVGFDFGFDQTPTDGDDGDDFDDDIVAAANAEVLATDDEGFYGQEFQFYGRPRSNSGDVEPTNGGYFGADGDEGLTRNRSLKEPNLTPITERSEFSTRNSFIGAGGMFGPASAGGFSAQSPAMARFPITSPLLENEITSFDELRKLRANAFGGSNGSLTSNSNRSSSQSMNAAASPTVNTRFAGTPGYFGHTVGGSPMAYGYSTESSGSSNPSSAHPVFSGPMFHDSPHSAASSGHLPFGADAESTPRKAPMSSVEPSTAVKSPTPLFSGSTTQTGTLNPNGGSRKVSSPTPAANGGKAHSRNGSGTESVTYVKERDPEAPNKPRWVMERRRTSEQGQLELIGRELVEGGWI